MGIPMVFLLVLLLSFLGLALGGDVYNLCQLERYTVQGSSTYFNPNSVELNHPKGWYAVNPSNTVAVNVTQDDVDARSPLVYNVKQNATRTEFWLMQMQPYSATFRGGFNYTFSFDVAAPTVSMKVFQFVIMSRDCLVTGSLPSTIFTSASNMFYRIPYPPGKNPTCFSHIFNLPNSTLSNTSWATVSFDFSVASDLHDALLGIYVQPTLATLSKSTIWNWQFRNLHLSWKSFVYTVPYISDLYTNISTDFVKIPTQSLVPDLSFSDAVNCPHKQDDLVKWETLGFNLQTDDVLVLPANKKILITSSSGLHTTDDDAPIIIPKIVIPSTSSLIFDDVDLNLHLTNVLVQTGGSLMSGSPLCRLQSYHTFTFHYADYKNLANVDDDLQPGHINSYFGATGIGVQGPAGQIDLHYYQYTPTWTRLATSLQIHDDIIILQQKVNWEVGQTIVVLTSSYYDFERNQNEIFTIKKLWKSENEEGTNMIQLDRPAQFFHYAGSEYQSEVMLLSRRCTIQSDPKNNTMTAIKRGAHIMTMADGRFSGLYLTRMGQINLNGRYPIHWHLSYSRPSSFIRDSALYDNFFRCITVHGTHNVTVERNVAYKTNGHCFYIEDGVEKDNKFYYNLGASPVGIGGPFSGPYPYSNRKDMAVAGGNGQFTGSFLQRADLLQPADVAPAPFYITNIENTFIGNAASGGFTGFAFPTLPEPLGAFFKVKYTAPKSPQIFLGNTAHSSGGTWMEAGACIYAGGQLSQDPTTRLYSYTFGRAGSSAYGLKLNQTKVWLCGNGISHWGFDEIADGLEVIDSYRCASWFSGRLVNMHCNAESKNPSFYRQESYGVRFYDTWATLHLSTIEFKNFRPHRVYPQTYETIIMIQLQNQGGYPTQQLAATRSLYFTDCDRSVLYQAPRDPGAFFLYGIYITTHMDWDGSLAMLAMNGASQGPVNQTRFLSAEPGTMSTSSSFGFKPAVFGPANAYGSFHHLDNDCVLATEWGVWICDMYYERKVLMLIFSMPSSFPVMTNWMEALQKPLPFYTPNNSSLGYQYLFGPSITKADRLMPFKHTARIMTYSGVGCWMDYNSTGGTPQNMTVSPSWGYANQNSLLSLPYPPGTTFNITVQWGLNIYIGNPQPVRQLVLASSFADLVANMQEKSWPGTAAHKYWVDEKNNNLFINLRTSPFIGGTGNKKSSDLRGNYTWVSTTELDGMYLPVGDNSADIVFTIRATCPEDRVWKEYNICRMQADEKHYPVWDELMAGQPNPVYTPVPLPLRALPGKAESEASAQSPATCPPVVKPTVFSSSSSSSSSASVQSSSSAPSSLSSKAPLAASSSSSSPSSSAAAASASSASASSSSSSSSSSPSSPSSLSSSPSLAPTSSSTATQQAGSEPGNTQQELHASSSSSFSFHHSFALAVVLLFWRH